MNGRTLKVTDIAARFARETDQHQLTVLRDDGLYRHLRFSKPGTSLYWFDLITVPGTLIFRGDGESFVFSRIEDMFEFFRNPAGGIDPQYWAEKVTSDRGSLTRYDQELLKDFIQEIIRDALNGDNDRRLSGLAAEARSGIVYELTGDESLDRDIVERFEYYANDNDRYAIHRKPPDFRFHDVWEWNCRDYYWWFLWACHGIVWGIARYDDAKKNASVTPGECLAGAVTETTLGTGLPGKLVRDRIPEIIRRDGLTPVIETASPADYHRYVRAKLAEELGEYLGSGDVAELADLVEVCFAAAALSGVSRGGLLELADQKRRERGGFDRRLVWLGNTPGTGPETAQDGTGVQGHADAGSGPGATDSGDNPGHRGVVS